MLAQQPRPGEAAQADFTQATELGVTIARITAVATRTPRMLVAPNLAAPSHTSNATRSALEPVRTAATAGRAAFVERVATANQAVIAAVHHEQQRLTQTGAAQRAAISQRFALSDSAAIGSSQ